MSPTLMRFAQALGIMPGVCVGGYSRVVDDRDGTGCYFNFKYTGRGMDIVAAAKDEWFEHLIP